MEKTKPEKSKASGVKRFQRQFISPFSLENCISRLNSRSEKTTLWAWRGATRLQANVWKTDDDSAGFQVYKAPKSAMEFQWGSSVTSARGAMFRQADGTTTVLVEAKTSMLGYMLFGVLMFFLWLMLSVTLIVPMLMEISLIAAVVVSGFTLFLVIAGSILYFDWQHADLLYIVRESLGDVETL